jgi:hypothetical protein
MELVAVAFAPSFRKRLCPQVRRFQDILSLVNDHAMGKTFFRDWALRVRNVRERAFLEGIALTETRAHHDLRQAFVLMWVDKSLYELRGRLKAHCRRS